MQDSPIQLGAIKLRGFEIPSSIRFGGNYKLTIHRLASGQRIVERLGPDDNEITFKGTFSGAEAESRVRDLNDLRLSGQAVWLTWKSFRFLVVIKSFSADYRSPWWIPYEISCVVIEQPGMSPANDTSIEAQISTDLGRALAILGGSDMQISALQVALAASNVSVAGTTDRANAVAAAQASLEAIDNEVNGRSSAFLTSDLANANGSSYANFFATIVTSSGCLATAINARSYIARINSNLVDARA